MTERFIALSKIYFLSLLSFFLHISLVSLVSFVRLVSLVSLASLEIAHGLGVYSIIALFSFIPKIQVKDETNKK